jgi:formylglycine-generating enzyme required for sulfatase activity
VTLWELLTRRRLFEEAEDERQLASLIYDQDVPRLRSIDPSLDRDLEAIVARATERRVADRIATARELAEYLQLYLEGKPLPIRPPTTAELVKRWLLTHKPVAAAGVVILATVVVAFVLIAGALARSQAALKKQQQAESERALDQVDALLSARPEAIPTIARSLELKRPEVEARLRDLWANADAPESQRLRVALALLPVDPGMIGYLQEELTRASPAEVLVLCDALRPYGPQIQEALWELASRPQAGSGQRLRAAVALAAFAPEDPRWPDLARQIVDPLLSAGPQEQGLWVSALEREKEMLRSPLAGVFRDPGQPAKRLTAAQILALFFAGHPEILADLAADANPDQYAILFPDLQTHRDEAVAWLGPELDRLAKPLEPAWQDQLPAPFWTTPEADLVRQIEQGQGMVTDHFALCQTLPLDQFLTVAEGLRPSGYRPACFRPYPAGKTAQVAALWVRDGHDWRLAHDATAADIRKQDADWRKQGFGPEDVAGYAVGAGKEAVACYAALWVRPGRAGAQLDVGTPPARTLQTMQQRQMARLILRTLTQFDLGGAQQFSSVWWKPDRLPDLNLFIPASDEAFYNSLVYPSNRFADLRLDGPPAIVPPGQRYQSQLTQVQTTALFTPNDAKVLFNRGMLSFLVGNNDKAVADMEAVIAKAPQYSDAFLYRALARARQGKVAEAREDLAAFQKLVSNAGWNFFLELAVTAYLGDEADAVRRLEAALPQHADDPDFLYRAACGYAVARQALLTKRPDQARAYADRAVVLFRQVAAGGFVYGFVFSYRNLLLNWPQETMADYPAFQEFLREGNIEQSYSAVWNDTAEQESADSHGLDPARHVERCRELAKAGYRPAGVSVLWLEDGRPPATASAWNRPVVPAAAREAQARRRAQVAATLLRLGQPERVWPLLIHSPDPRVRSYLVHAIGALRAEPQDLVHQLTDEANLSARRALILALGEFPENALPAEDRDRVATQLLAWYRDDPDPGLHAAAGWLLRSRVWGQVEQVKELDDRVKRAAPVKAAEPRWVMNTKGETLVVLPGPVEFWMGSPAGETDRADNERLHRERIPRSFAIGAREVTLPEFEEYFAAVYPGWTHAHMNRYSPDPDGPAIDVSWLEAAKYCRWLSDREHVPEKEMCFPPLDQIKENMVLPADYLHRTGYRLPTVAEWEYASRARAETSRYYGGSASLLGNYAYYAANSHDRAWSGGRLEPNDFGLFDVYGNVWEWCQDYRHVHVEDKWLPIAERGAHGQPHEDWEQPDLMIPANSDRAMRGGSFLDPAGRLRSAYHQEEVLTHVSRDAGFRLARTVR